LHRSSAFTKGRQIPRPGQRQALLAQTHCLHTL
jgi:hypothetical protein